ncbi:MAG: Gfo/Idh/MocA family oxidoreductase [Planctomycetota bacterium]
MSRIRTALIGCGKVGQTHAQALQTLPESEFVAACDAQGERAAAFASRFGVLPFTDVATRHLHQSADPWLQRRVRRRENGHGSRPNRTPDGPCMLHGIFAIIPLQSFSVPARRTIR